MVNHMVRRPRTRVRDYVKRDGTEVREHERSLAEHDRRDRIIDRIRIDAARRRREEDSILDEALATYLESREDGDSHEEAMRKAAIAVKDEAVVSDFEFTDSDLQRLQGELERVVGEANARGMRETESRASARDAAEGFREQAREDDDEERMLGISDALRDDDEVFSLADVAEDPGERRAGEREDEREEQLTVQSQVRGLYRDTKSAYQRGNAALVKGYEEFKRREAEKEARRQAVAAEAARRAQERQADAGLLGSGPTGKKPGSAVVYEAGQARVVETSPSVSISTVPPERRRVIRSGPEPAAPEKGTGRLDE